MSGAMTWALRSALCVLALSLGCGASYVPPAPPTTGVPAAELGQVVDADVALPFLSFPQHGAVGANLTLRLDLERAARGVGQGTFPARVTYESARVGSTSAQVEDRSGGTTSVSVVGDTWTTGRIGPIEIESTLFEFTLRGTTVDGGWSAQGESRESQTGQAGAFQAWRRHRFLVTSTDFFATGRVDLIEWVRGSQRGLRANLTSVSPDAVVSTGGGSVFVVNRLTFDNVQRLDPERDFATAWQAGTGQGSNPHDALWISDDQLYVTRYEPPFNDVAVLRPQGGSFRDSIPLADLATNRDQTPRADRMLRVGPLVFVGLQNINRSFDEYGDAILALIDTTTNDLVGQVDLPGKNPGTMQFLPNEEGRDEVYVGLSGIFPGLLPQELSGGIAVVDVANRVFDRWALDDDVAGGNVGSFAMISPRLGVAVISTSTFVNRLITFDPQTGEVIETLIETTDFVPEIAADASGLLAVPDRSFATPGVCLYQLSEQQPAAPLGCTSLPVPPFSIRAID